MSYAYINKDNFYQAIINTSLLFHSGLQSTHINCDETPMSVYKLIDQLHNNFSYLNARLCFIVKFGKNINIFNMKMIFDDWLSLIINTNVFFFLSLTPKK